MMVEASFVLRLQFASRGGWQARREPEIGVVMHGVLATFDALLRAACSRETGLRGMAGRVLPVLIVKSGNCIHFENYLDFVLP